MQKKYVAYVGSYSYNGQARGITVFDVNVEDGSFTAKRMWTMPHGSVYRTTESISTLLRMRGLWPSGSCRTAASPA